MGRYEADLTKVSAGFTIYPKGEYEFSFGTPKAFKREGKKGANFGVGFPLTCMEVHDGDPNMKGKKHYYNGFMHSEGAQSFTKGMVMAAYGYVTDQKAEKNQQAFDEKFAGEDWSFDPDNGSVGSVFKDMEGKRIIYVLDVEAGLEEGTTQQKWVLVRPV